MRSDALRRLPLLARLLLALGAAAQLAAGAMLLRVDPVLEYAVPAPEVRRIEAEEGRPARVDGGIEPMIEARDGVEEQLGDAVAALSMGGIRSGAEVSCGGSTETAALQGVEARWLETNPRRLTQGRWMDASELRQGARVAVLDEDLAFALFGSGDALDREIEIEGEEYRVIGTLRHRRGVGEASGRSAYVPLRAAARQGVQFDIVTARALAAVPDGLGQSFSDAMRSAWGAGELHDLRKERVGALLLSRLLLCGLGLALVARLGRRFAGQIRRWRAQIAALRAREYARRWLGPALLRTLGGLLGAALLLGAAYALLRFAVAPVYSYTEWVPESLVSASAIRTVFWNRAADAARLISIRTPDSARIAFWGALDRAGAVLLLLGLALRWKNLKIMAESGNRKSEGPV